MWNILKLRIMILIALPVWREAHNGNARIIIQAFFTDEIKLAMTLNAYEKQTKN